MFKINLKKISVDSKESPFMGLLQSEILYKITLDLKKTYARKNRLLAQDERWLQYIYFALRSQFPYHTEP